MISGNRSRRNMSAFSCAVSGLLTLIAWSLGSTPEVIWLCDRGFKMLQFNGLSANENEFPRIREQGFPFM